MITLNATFEGKLASGDEGYESSSENFNIPTPLQKHPGSTMFPALKMPLLTQFLVTPCSTRDPQLRPVCRRLTYSSLDGDDTIEDEVPPPLSASQMWNHTHVPHELSSKHNLKAHIHLEEEEDFQTVSLDNEHWTTKEIPDRPLCIHEHLLPHGLCPYLCPYANHQTPSYYKTMDLSDISEFEVMTTSSDEDNPALEDSMY